MMTETCALSVCGDGVTDTGATPPEECDDGGTSPGDGCDSMCQMEAAVPPSAFRITDLDLVSPRITVSDSLLRPNCQDITNDCARAIFGICGEDSINTQLETAIDPTSSGGSYDLHIVELFQPLNPAAASTPTEVHLNAACMEGPPESCGPDPSMPDFVMGSAANMTSGTCYTPDAAEVEDRAGSAAAYDPAANTVSGPCYISSIPALTVTISGIAIPLTNVSISATYSGAPPSRLISGVVTGFLSSDDAVAVTIPVLDDDPLYEHLQAGNDMHMGTADGCNVGGGVDEDDRDMEGGVTGFRFFLNFEADEVTWTP